MQPTKIGPAKYRDALKVIVIALVTRITSCPSHAHQCIACDTFSSIRAHSFHPGPQLGQAEEGLIQGQGKEHDRGQFFMPYPLFACRPPRLPYLVYFFCRAFLFLRCCVYCFPCRSNACMPAGRLNYILNLKIEMYISFK